MREITCMHAYTFILTPMYIDTCALCTNKHVLYTCKQPNWHACTYIITCTAMTHICCKLTLMYTDTHNCTCTVRLFVNPSWNSHSWTLHGINPTGNNVMFPFSCPRERLPLVHYSNRQRKSGDCQRWICWCEPAMNIASCSRHAYYVFVVIIIANLFMCP